MQLWSRGLLLLFLLAGMLLSIAGLECPLDGFQLPESKQGDGFPDCCDASDEGALAFPSTRAMHTPNADVCALASKIKEGVVKEAASMFAQGAKLARSLRPTKSSTARKLRTIAAWAEASGEEARKYVQHFHELNAKFSEESKGNSRLSPSKINLLRSAHAAASQASMEHAMADAANATPWGSAPYFLALLASGCAETCTLSEKWTKGGSAKPLPDQQVFRLCAFRNLTQNSETGAQSVVGGVWLNQQIDDESNGSVAPAWEAHLVSWLRAKLAVTSDRESLTANAALQENAFPTMMPDLAVTVESSEGGEDAAVRVLHKRPELLQALLPGSVASRTYVMSHGEPCATSVPGAPARRFVVVNSVCDDLRPTPSWLFGPLQRGISGHSRCNASDSSTDTTPYRILSVRENGSCEYHVTVGTPLMCKASQAKALARLAQASKRDTQ